MIFPVVANMKLARSWCLIAMLTTVLANCRAFAEEQVASTELSKSKPAPSAEEISTWITQLNDNRYLIREEATRQLQEAGAAALAQLRATADGESPEAADRSVWIMRRLSTSKDSQLKRRALENLAELKKRPQVAGAAKAALDTLRHQEAVVAIEQLGGKYVESELMVQAGGIVRTGRLGLDSRWHGGDAGIVHLRNLNGMRLVRVVGTDISAAALKKELPECKSLQMVCLYGTKLTPEDAESLRKLLPAPIEVDYRRGGLLGVASTLPDGPGPAVVRMVTPGGAAATAGVQAGDVIEKLDGEPLANFKALTQKIGEKQPGDEVEITIIREGKPMDFKVKLGAWTLLDE